MYKLLLLLSLALLFSCKGVDSDVSNEASAEQTASESQDDSRMPIHLDRINLPKGYSIDVYAEGIDNARSLAISPNGTLFVGTRQKGDVYAIVDTNGDGKGDKKHILDTGLNMPNGVALKDGDLYVAEVNQILKYADIENNLENTPEPEIIYSEYPTEKHHGWKYIAFGPDDKLYVPVGAPCNICESEDRIFNTITRLNADGTGMEIVHEGIRNTVGFTWHPETDELWFTDNGRDHFGDDKPGCELNKATADNQHFGYPYCHEGRLLDDEFGSGKNCADYVAPVQILGAHVAPLGCEFLYADRLGGQSSGSIVMAEHGSWNRSQKSGYRLTIVDLDANGNATDYRPFASGWLDDPSQEVWGRPVDLEFMSDGSMLVSDDMANVIYRISYSG